MNIMKKGLTAFDLKILGIVLMVFDHIEQMFYFEGVPTWFGMLGRLVAPIFLFLSAEGYHYTRNRRNYMLNLLFGYAICSSIFFALTTFLPNSKVELVNSIFGTLFLSLLTMWIYDGFFGEDKHIKESILGLVFLLLAPVIIISLASNSSVPRFLVLPLKFVIPTLVTVEGGIAFILLALLFHIFRNSRIMQCTTIVLFSILTLILDSSSYQWMMIFSTLPIYLYNGKQGKKSKWFFYIFYPSHIILLYVISTLFFL